MRIALVVPGGVDRSGEERVIPALLALLRRMSAHHQVRVFALAQESRQGEWMLAGARIYNAGRPLRHLRTLAALVREHRREPFDLVQSIWAGSCGAIAVVAARMLGVPSLVHAAGGEFIALPQIAYGGRLRRRGRLFASIVLRGATGVTAASQPMIDQLRMLGRRAQRIPLGVDLQTWPVRMPVRRNQQLPVRLIHLASLNRIKDQPTLLQALALLAAQGHPFHLDVAGEDTLRGAIQAEAERFGLQENIHFHGFQTHRQLRPLMEQAHINVISSLHEAGPLAVLEAAISGVPTVGTAVGHIAEWTPDAALSVAPGDAAGLAAAIARLTTDEDLRLALAREAQRRAQLEDADRTFAQFDALYAHLHGGR